MGPCQRETSCAKARSSACVWIRRIACSSVMPKRERSEAKGERCIELKRSEPIRWVQHAVEFDHGLCVHFKGLTSQVAFWIKKSEKKSEASERVRAERGSGRCHRHRPEGHRS